MTQFCCQSDTTTASGNKVKDKFCMHPCSDNTMAARAYYFVIVNFQSVKLVADKRRFALQSDLIRRSAVNITHCADFAPDVRVTIERQRHLLWFTRSQCSVDRRNVKYLKQCQLKTVNEDIISSPSHQCIIHAYKAQVNKLDNATHNSCYSNGSKSPHSRLHTDLCKDWDTPSSSFHTASPYAFQWARNRHTFPKSVSSCVRSGSPSNAWFHGSV